MKKFICGLMFVFAGLATADNTFTFVPASNYACMNYCTGYYTSDAAYSIGYINMTYSYLGYKLTTTVNGKVYQGTVPAVFNGGPLYSADGTFITMTDVNYTVGRTCVRVGRGQSCTTRYYVTDGTVTP